MSASATTRIEELAVNTIRTLAMDAVQKADSGHPGTPMGLAPLGYVLYTRAMRHDPADPHWPGRDRFVLSAGHACMLQYALLHLCGYGLPLSEIERFRQWGSMCPGHPERGRTPGIEISTGPLGQGFANAVGFALAREMQAARFPDAPLDWRTFVIASDGDMMEGVTSEAASLAGNLGIGSLVAVYDDNKISIEGSTEIAFTEKVAHRFSDYGWDVRELGEDATLDDIESALDAACAVTDAPSLVVLRTHIAYGSPNKQDTAGAHGSPLGEEEVRLTKEALGWPWPAEAFRVPDEVREHFAAVGERGAVQRRAWEERFEAFRSRDADGAATLERMWRGDVPPDLAEDALPRFDPAADGAVATRSAGGKALNWLAPRVPELAGGAADLAPSTSTLMDGYGSVQHGDFSGRNLHFGIREHAMGAVVNGMVASGFRAYGATFLSFSDYMREPIRMAALMELPSVFVYTHDSIGLGEDGPTHQPVEQLACLRAIPNVCVIRPADANETVQAWAWAIAQRSTPTALALSRQKLPVLDPERVPPDAVERGAYVYADADGEAPSVVLIGTGSEVSLCVEAAAQLGGAARVVSMPSWERFAAQSPEYRDGVLPPGVPRLSVEAGIAQGWSHWADECVCLDHFGESAPGAEVMERLGFTAENVAARAREMLP